MRWKFRRPFFKEIQFREAESQVFHKGRVLDLSDSGMRLVTFDKIDEAILHLFLEDFEAVGRVVWLRKRWVFFWRCLEIGIQFLAFQPLKKNLFLDQRG